MLIKWRHLRRMAVQQKRYFSYICRSLRNWSSSSAMAPRLYIYYRKSRWNVAPVHRPSHGGFSLTDKLVLEIDQKMTWSFMGMFSIIQQREVPVWSLSWVVRIRPAHHF
jgi:hypothetical protein